MNRREFLRLAAAAPLAAVAACSGASEPEAESSPSPSPTPSPTETEATPSPAATEEATLEWFPFRERGPRARRDHSLIAAEGTLLLFGGRAGGKALADLWTWSPAEGWKEVAPGGPAPAARFGHNAAFVEGRLLVFAGQGGTGVFFDDLWEFELQSRRWKELAGGAASPSARYGAGGSVVGSALVISHGFTDAGRFDDTWSFDGTWEDLTPGQGPRPVERCLHRLVYLESAGRLVLFGGQTTGTAFLGDTWLLDPDASRWTELDGRAPSPRNFYAAEATEATLYLFGGSAEGGDLDDLWSFDGSRWTKEEPVGDPPSGRNGHDMALIDGNMMLFGGTDSSGELDDFWQLMLP